MKRTTTWLLGAVVLTMVGVGCNLALGLDQFKNCPQDPGCPAAGGGGTGGTVSTSTTSSAGGTGGTGGTLPEMCTVNGVRDGKETDTDCGGGLCPPCGDGKGCANGADCTSKVCISGSCHAAACDDAVKNGDETDQDCGGTCGATCGPMKACAKDGDCKGGSCVGGVCAPTCTDGEKSGDETGKDCGGMTCAACPDGEGCAVGGDCQSGVCQGGMCKNDLLWAKAWGDTDPTHFHSALAVASNPAGDAVFTGYFQGDVDFGGGVQTSAGTGDVFITKLDNAGNYVWSRHYGNTYRTAGMAIAIDPTGNIVVGGSFHGALTIGTYALSGGLGVFGDAYFAKFDATGKPLWAQAGTSGGGSNLVRSMATDASGNLFAAGSFTGTLSFNGAASAGGSDAFLVKLTPSGPVSWTKSFGDASSQSGRSVAIDAAGDVFFAAVSDSSMNLGGAPLGNAGTSDIYLAKYTNAGQYVWGKRFGDSADQGNVVLAVDLSGNLLLAGSFAGSIDFGGGPLVSAGLHDYFVAKLDTDGNHVWSRRFGDVGDDNVIYLAVDGSGNVLVSGTLAGTVDFGGGPLVSMGGDASGGDVFAAKLDAGGNHKWSRRYGDSFPQNANSVASGGMGSLLMVGNFAGALSFGAGASFTNLGGLSMFAAKLLTPQ